MNHETWLIGLLHDKNFISFMERCLLGYEGKESLTKGRPSELSETLSWELASFLRRATAYDVWPKIYRDTESAQEKDGFYSIPLWLAKRYSSLSSRLDAHSTLWVRTEPLLANMRYFRPILEDLHTALFRDGMDLGYERLRDITLNQRLPVQSNVEQLARNAFNLLTQHEVLPDNSPSCVEELEKRLFSGVSDVEELPQRKAGYNPVRKTLTAFNTVEERMTPPLDAKRGPNSLFDIIMNSEYILVNRPFYRCNGVLEVLIRATASHAAGIPAFKIIPFSTIRHSWEQGVAKGAELVYSHGEAVIDTPFGMDFTPFFIQFASLLEHSLEEIESETSRIAQTDAAFRAEIETNRMLTLRQKQCLFRMMDSPLSPIDVASYAHQFDTAISTARYELKRLAELHLCETHYEGKKQVFLLSHNIWPVS